MYLKTTCSNTLSVISSVGIAVKIDRISVSESIGLRSKNWMKIAYSHWNQNIPCFKAFMIYPRVNILWIELACGSVNMVTREVTVIMMSCCPMIVPIIFYVIDFELRFKVWNINDMDKYRKTIIGRKNKILKDKKQWLINIQNLDSISD